MSEKMIDDKKSILLKGTVLSDSKRQRWIVGDPLDIDGSRDIYAVASYDDKMRNYTAAAIFKTLDYDPQLVVDVNDFSDHTKIISDICNPTTIEEWKRQKNLKHLGVTPILSIGTHASHDKFYSYMITMRYVENMQQLLTKNKKGFILPTIYKVIGQMIHVLEYIHSLGYYNIFCISSDKLLRSYTNPNNIYLDVIDYGKTPECLAFKSRDAQVGKACGDLESLIYMALDWMKLQLPWSNLTDDVAIDIYKIKAFDNVEVFLKDVFVKFQVLAPVRHFMTELASTVNANKPDYGKIRLFMSNGIRNIGNVNHNLEGGINFKAELNLRKNSVKYNKTVDKKNSDNIPSHKLIEKAVGKSSKRQGKSSIVLKKNKKKKVNLSGQGSNHSGLQHNNNNTKLDNVEKAPSSETKTKSNTAEPMMQTVPVEESFANAASFVTSAAESGTIPNDTLKATMTNEDPKPLTSFDSSAIVAQSVTITSVATTTSTEKLQHLEMVEPEQRGAKRSSEKIEESAASPNSKRMKVISTETRSGGSQEEKPTGTELSKKEKQQQQLTASSVISNVTSGTSRNDTEEDFGKKNSDNPGERNTRVDGLIQKYKFAGAMSQQQIVSKQMQDLQKKLENLENQLISRDDSRDIATKDPNPSHCIQAVIKRRSFHVKAFNSLHGKVMALVPKAHEQKIDVRELLNKSNDVAVCIENFESKLKSSLNKFFEQFCQTKLAGVDHGLQKMKQAVGDANIVRDQREKSKMLTKEVVINLVRTEKCASSITNVRDDFSNKKSSEKKNDVGRMTKHIRTQDSKDSHSNRSRLSDSCGKQSRTGKCSKRRQDNDSYSNPLKKKKNYSSSRNEKCSKRRQDNDPYSNPLKKKKNDSSSRSEKCSKRRQDNDSYSNPLKKKKNDSSSRNERSSQKLQSPVKSKKSSSSDKINDRSTSLTPSMASNQIKKKETSAGSTTLLTFLREDKESKQRKEDKPKDKSEEKSAYVQVTMDQNVVHNIAQEQENKMNEKNEKYDKLDEGLNHVEDSATRPNQDSNEIKKSLVKNANGEDLERVLRMLQRSDITLAYVQKKK